MTLKILIILMMASLSSSFTSSPQLSPKDTQLLFAKDHYSTYEEDDGINNKKYLSSRRNIFTSVLITTTGFLFSFSSPVEAKLEAVNRPDLLPSESGLNVIQTENFLTKGQARRMDELCKVLERDTGFRLRVLCQAYPRTPGLAIRDYWDLGKEGQKDDKYIVLVVDEFGGRGNVLNFNVGEGVKFALPNVFWTRLSSKYGTTFYVKKNGVDLAVINALEAIALCLRTEDFCVNVPEEGASLKRLGLLN